MGTPPAVLSVAAPRPVRARGRLGSTAAYLGRNPSLVVASIPEPTVGRRWGEEQPLPQPTLRVPSGAPACKFADRCPHAMPICVEAPPPLCRTDPDRAAACFLYRDAPELPPARMNEVLSVRTAPVGG